MLLELLAMPLTRGEIRKVFDDYNIPEEIANFVLKFDLTSKPSWLYRYNTPAFAVIGVLFAFPFYLWLDKLHEQTVLSAAQKQAALFYDLDRSTNAIALLIIIILLAHTVSRYIPLLVSPSLKAQIFIHDYMSINNKVFLKFPYKLFRRRKPRKKTSSPIEYLPALPVRISLLSQYCSAQHARHERAHITKPQRQFTDHKRRHAAQFNSALGQ